LASLRGKYWTIATLFRLLLPAIFPDSLETLLHLDCDTIGLDNVSTLFEFDLGHNIAAAVVGPQDAIDDNSLVL
jgi:lipopolysaccharide biosynthesis glycosyltransferase